MKSRLILGLFALTGLIAWSAALGFTEDKKPVPMTEQEMWAKMAEWAQPGDKHKNLDFLCGTWKAAGKMWSSMGEMGFEGEATNKWILGNRFVETTYAGPFMGSEFQGRSLTGYDNGKKQYQSIWIMTMGTGIDMSTGTYDEKTKTFTWSHSGLAPNGETHQARDVMVIKSSDEYVTTSYSTAPGGKEVKEMEITYKRVTAQ